MDLYLNYSLRKSRFPLNLTYIHTDKRTDISVYRVASLLKRLGNALTCTVHTQFIFWDGIGKTLLLLSGREGTLDCKFYKIPKFNVWFIHSLVWEFSGWVVRALARSSGGRWFESTHSITMMPHSCPGVDYYEIIAFIMINFLNDDS